MTSKRPNWNTSFSKICLVVYWYEDRPANQVHRNQQESQIPALRMHSVIADKHFRATSLGRDTRKLLIGPNASLQAKCNKEGFNSHGRTLASKARIGIIGNKQNNCLSGDSRIDSIRIPRQSWDEYALIMNARLMRGTSRQEDKQIWENCRWVCRI